MELVFGRFGRFAARRNVTKLNFAENSIVQVEKLHLTFRQESRLIWSMHHRYRFEVTYQDLLDTQSGNTAVHPGLVDLRPAREERGHQGGFSTTQRTDATGVCDRL